MSTVTTATETATASAPDATRATSPHFRMILWTAVYCIPALSVMTSVEDLDVWWHLRTAEWITAHGKLPQTDPFTAFGAGQQFHAYSWLFELILWVPFRLFGLSGVLLFRAVFLFVLLAAVHRFIAKRQPDFVPQVVLFALTCVAFVPLMSERPWLFTILFYLLTLDVILDLRAGRAAWTVWCLPLAFALWANMHIQFVYGLALLGLACVAPLLDRLLWPSDEGENADRPLTPGWWRLVTLTGLCFLATLANPYGFGLYGVVRAYAGHTAGYNFFPELQSLAFREAPDWIVLGMTLAAVFVLGRRTTGLGSPSPSSSGERGWGEGVPLASENLPLTPDSSPPKRGRGEKEGATLSAFDILLLVGSAILAFKVKRDLWFVVLAALPILATVRPAAFRGDVFPLTLRRRLVLAGCVAVVIVVAGWQRGLWGESLETKVASAFPVRAADVVEKRELPGPLYNPIDWGGYLIWRLPQYPAAIDGRANLHGNERVSRFHATWKGLPGWRDDPDLAASRTVVIQAWAPLAGLLRLDGRFELVHEDPVALVFVSRSVKTPTPDRRSHASAE